jgi:hypothetical protein
VSAPVPPDEPDLWRDHPKVPAFGFPFLLLLAIAFATLCAGGFAFGDSLLDVYGGQNYTTVTPITGGDRPPDGLRPPPTVDGRQPAQPTLSVRPPLSPATGATGVGPGGPPPPPHVAVPSRP